MNGISWLELLPLLGPLAWLGTTFLILLWGMTLPQNFNRLTLSGCLLGTAGLFAGMAAAAQGRIFGLGLASFLTSNFAFLLDSLDLLGAGWFLVSTLLVFLLLFWPQSPGTSSESFRRETLGGFLAVGFSQLLVVSSNPWVQWTCLVAIGWSLMLILGRVQEDGARGRIAAACLVWWTIADLGWLVGLGILSRVLPLENLSWLATQVPWASLSAGEMAICVSALSLLLLSLMLRCGLYPLMSWSGPAAVSYRDAAWIIAFGFGPAMLVALRWSPVFAAFPETRWLMSGGGVLSAVLLGIMAWAGANGPARMVHLASAQLALVWLGVGQEIGELPSFAAMTFCLIWLLTLLPLGLAQLKGRHGNFGMAANVLFVAAGFLCLGVLGQEQVLLSIQSTMKTAGGNAWLFLLGALAAQLLAAVTLFREIHPVAASTQVPAADAQRGVSAVAWIGLAFLTGGVLAAVMIGPFSALPGGRVQIHLPLLSGIVMLIGLVAARMWPAVADTADPHGAEAPWEGIRRLARSEFYMPAVIQAALLLPIRAASQLSRFFEWILIGNLTQKVPAWIVRGIAERAELTEETTDERTRVWHLLSAVAVMLTGVAAGLFL